MTHLPYPHARNDCEVCRERDADFAVTAGGPVPGRRKPLVCRKCLGTWAATEVHIRDGRATLTLEWAPGRLADHGLTGDSR